jgi:ankyrin repeat protein
MKNDNSGDNHLAPAGAFELARRSDSLALRGLEYPLSPSEKAVSLARIGDIFGAVEAGDIGMVRAILSANPSQSSALNDGGETPLFPAARFGFTEIAKLLVLYGADLNAHAPVKYFDESYGWTAYDTPLHDAAYRRHAEVAEFLLTHGSEVNSEDWCGRTPLFAAATNADAKFAGLLLRYGSNVHARISVSEADMPSLWNSRYIELGATALHYAVRGRLRDSDGFHNTDVIALLIDNGADINAVNKWGQSPLHLAAEFGHIEAAKFLLSHGANPSLRDFRGMTPLEIAKSAGKLETADTITIYLKSKNPKSSLEGSGQIEMAPRTNPGIHSKHEMATEGVAEKTPNKKIGSMTVEEILKDPIILDSLAIVGEENYNSGITDPAEWHAELFRDMEDVAEGLGLELEPIFGTIWAAVTGNEDYIGGIGGIYGAKMPKGGNSGS